MKAGQLVIYKDILYVYLYDVQVMEGRNLISKLLIAPKHGSIGENVIVKADQLTICTIEEYPEYFL